MKKQLTVLLSVALTLVSATACGESPANQTGRPDEIKGAYTLYDYENYCENFELLRISENFGVLSKNNEEDYVKNDLELGLLKKLNINFEIPKLDIYCGYFLDTMAYAPKKFIEWLISKN